MNWFKKFLTKSNEFRCIGDCKENYHISQFNDLKTEELICLLEFKTICRFAGNKILCEVLTRLYQQTSLNTDRLDSK